MIHQKNNIPKTNPDTKYSKYSGIYGIAVGTASNILILTAGIFLAFKSGISSTIDTAALVLLLLLLMGKFSIKNAVIAEIVARGSTTIARQAATYFAALIIFGAPLGSGDIVRMAVLIIVSSIFGILFFSSIYDSFHDKSEFSFPMVKPRIDLFNSLGGDTKNNGLLAALGLTSVYSFFVNIVKVIPRSFSFAKGFGLANNPMLVAIGYIIGYKTYLVMGIGFLYSAVIYFTFGSADFASHLMNPYIYSVIISFTLTQGIITICTFIKKSGLGKPEGKAKSVSGAFSLRYGRSLIWAGAFLVFNIIFFSRYVSPNVSMPFWLFLVLIPVTMALAVSTLHGVARTGFWFSALEDLLPILTIILTFTHNISAVILVTASCLIFEMSGIYFVVNSEFSESFNISKETNIGLNILSNVIGGVLVIALVLVFNKTLGLGSSELPIPFANTLGMTVKGMVEALSMKALPLYINVHVILVSSLICVILNKYKLSPVVIIGGIMLPFNIYMTMAIGALISYILRKNTARYRPVFSGIATADGVISSLAAVLGFFR